jgi:hypothetical protein
MGSWTEPSASGISGENAGVQAADKSLLLTIRIPGGTGRSVAGPPANRLETIGLGIRNYIQVVVMSKDTTDRTVHGFLEHRQKNAGDTTVDLTIGGLDWDGTYRFLVLVGYWERTYAESPGTDYQYTSAAPTLLLAGITEGSPGEFQGDVPVLLDSLWVDTGFAGPEGTRLEPEVTDGKPQTVELFPGAWTARWRIRGYGFDNLVKAGGKRAARIEELVGGAARMKGIVGIGAAAPVQVTLADESLKDTGGANDQGFGPWDLAVDLSPYTKSFTDTTGFVNFNLDYRPFGPDTVTWGAHSPAASTWTIRNGVNNAVQNDGTTFSVTGAAQWNKATDSPHRNGNGGVRFAVRGAAWTAAITGVQLVEERGDEWLIEFTAWGYTGAVEAYCGVLPVADRSVLNYADYTLIDTSLRAGTHRAVIPAPTDKTNYEVWVQLRQEGKKTERGFGHYQALFVASAGDDTTGTGSRTSPLSTIGMAVTKIKAVYANAHFWPGKGTAAPDPASIGILDPVARPAVSITGTIANTPPLLLYAETPDPGGDITLTGNGTLITVGSGVTLTLKDITLKGKSDNNAPLVRVNGGTLILDTGAAIQDNGATTSGAGVYATGGTVTMRAGSKVTGNTSTGNYVYIYGAGVYVIDGTFNMDGGEISGNTAQANSNQYSNGRGFGGGVYVHGTFTMKNGKISNNTVTSNYSHPWGGGVNVVGTFDMQGGEISGNTAYANVGTAQGAGVWVSGTFTMSGTSKIINNSLSSHNGSYDTGVWGGGVYAVGGVFTMSGGEISGNTISIQRQNYNLTSWGGGVYTGGVFNMTGGTIRDNTANYGGGVAVDSSGAFTKSGSSIIYGDGDTTYTAGTDENTALTGNGHAVYAGAGPRKRNSTAGTTVDLNSGENDNWE